MSRKYVEKSFLYLFEIVSEKYPDIDIILALNDDAGKARIGVSSRRQFAFTDDDEPIKISVATKIFYQSKARVDGILMHEFGHAILMYQEKDHTEKDADKVAEKVFNCYIYYDEDLVQNTDHGIRPRPRNI